MGVVGIVLAALGGGIAAHGKLTEGDAADKLGQFNSKMLGYQAEGALEQGKQQVGALREQREQDISSVRAGAAAQGVDVNSGDALRVQEDIAAQAAVDELVVENNAALEAWGFNSQAAVETWKGNQLKKASKNAAFGSLLGGAADSYGSGVQSGVW